MINYLPWAVGLGFFGVVAGLFILFNPARVIQWQIDIYAKINWRMAPISMPKELKNTKDMGLFLALVSLLGIIYIKFILK